MDGLSDKVETWPDRIICLSYFPLILKKKTIFDFKCQYNSFSFNRIILKLADKVDINDILEVYENCLAQII